MRQDDLRRLYLRGQSVGTLVHEILPWATLATCNGTCKVHMGQCTTGLLPWGIDAATDRDNGHSPSLTYTFSNERVQIAHDLFQVNRDLFYGRSYSSTVHVADARGFHLGDPTIPLEPDGSIAGPPSGGTGCLACADTVNMRFPPHLTETLNIAGGTTRRTTTGDVRVARKTTAGVNL
eukprot:3966-Pyramimonas_sp.AAC.1